MSSFEAVSNPRPGEHFLHLYDDAEGLLDLLQPFLAEGLRKGEATVVIATPRNLAAVERRLTREGFDLVAARWQGQYLPMDAKATLAQFMLSGMPDADLFDRTMTDVLARARRKGRPVRAFGEMVALLWNDGQRGATVQLERLWETLCRRESLPLFCAYPKACFGDDAVAELDDICRAHTCLVAA